MGGTITKEDMDRRLEAERQNREGKLQEDSDRLKIAIRLLREIRRFIPKSMKKKRGQIEALFGDIKRSTGRRQPAGEWHDFRKLGKYFGPR